MINKMTFVPKTKEATKDFKFAVIAYLNNQKSKGTNSFHKLSLADRIGIIGFFNDNGKLIESTPKLVKKTLKTFQNRGELTDTPIDARGIDLGRNVRQVVNGVYKNFYICIGK